MNAKKGSGKVRWAGSGPRIEEEIASRDKTIAALRIKLEAAEKLADERLELLSRYDMLFWEVPDWSNFKREADELSKEIK